MVRGGFEPGAASLCILRAENRRQACCLPGFLPSSTCLPQRRCQEASVERPGLLCEGHEEVECRLWHVLARRAHGASVTAVCGTGCQVLAPVKVWGRAPVCPYLTDRTTQDGEGQVSPLPRYLCSCSCDLMRMPCTDTAVFDPNGYQVCGGGGDFSDSVFLGKGRCISGCSVTVNICEHLFWSEVTCGFSQCLD